MYPKIRVSISNKMTHYTCLDSIFENVINTNGHVINSLNDCYECDNMECKIKKDIRSIEQYFFNNINCALCGRKLYFPYFILLYKLKEADLLPKHFRPICCYCKKDGKEPSFL